MLQGVLPLHETSDMVLVIRLRRIIEGGMRDLAGGVMEHYRFWYHDEMDVTSQVRELIKVPRPVRTPAHISTILPPPNVHTHTRT